MAVTGLSVGERRVVTMDPADAYGENNPELRIDIPAKQAPEGLKTGDKVSCGATAVVALAVDIQGVTFWCICCPIGKASLRRLCYALDVRTKHMCMCVYMQRVLTLLTLLLGQS